MADLFDDLETFLDLFQPPVSRSALTCEGSGGLEEFFDGLSPTFRVEEESCPATLLTDTDLEGYNPLGTSSTMQQFEQQLELNIVGEMLKRGPFPLGSFNSFEGQGVYALFYTGDFPLYESIRSVGAGCPIYVGKSTQQGRRKGLSGETVRALFHRLKSHARSIRLTNLDPTHFLFRFVCLPRRWVGYAEHALIEFYQPLWNICLDGFGNHPQGARRAEQIVSEWDTIHPGRLGTSLNTRNRHAVESKVQDFLPHCIRSYQASVSRLVTPKSGV